MPIGFPRLDYYEVGSTLDIAREHSGRGALHGTLVTASHQTAGRGRRGARWRDDGPGASALMTFVLRPGFALADSWRAPFLVSLACVEFLRSADYAEAHVKWPNDLALGAAKVGGTLVEAVEGALVAGIGINVAQADFDVDAGYQVEPISLQMARLRYGAGAPLNATQVIDGVAAALDRLWPIHEYSGAALLEAWRAYQTVGHAQSGIALASGAVVRGAYVDVRPHDGAGLLRVAGNADLVAVLPTAA